MTQDLQVVLIINNVKNVQSILFLKVPYSNFDTLNQNIQNRFVKKSIFPIFAKEGKVCFVYFVKRSSFSSYLVKNSKRDQLDIVRKLVIKPSLRGRKREGPLNNQWPTQRNTGPDHYQEQGCWEEGRFIVRRTQGWEMRRDVSSLGASSPEQLRPQIYVVVEAKIARKYIQI